MQQDELLKKYEAKISELQKELAAQTEKAARSSAELEQFIYAASHDLQEPLRMITSYVKLMQKSVEKGDSQNLAEFMGFVTDSSLHMQVLISDLLQLSRINRIGNPFIETDLNDVLQRAMAHLSNNIKENEAQILTCKLPTITCDSVQIMHLFQNLIDNAIKYKGAGKKPLIQISVKDCGDDYQFSVADNGIGIEKKFHERIFIIFQRLHPRAEYEGTGVGLAVCKKIVERHGGKIWVESEGEGGSVFYFTLKK